MVFQRAGQCHYSPTRSPERTKDKITSEDIIATVDAGTAAGVIADEEKNAIENIFELESRTVPSSMTSRENIIYFLLSDSKKKSAERLSTLRIINTLFVTKTSITSSVSLTLKPFWAES